MPAASFTRSEFRSQFGREVQDESGVYFSTDWQNDTLNDAMEAWCEQTRLRRANAQIDIVAQQSVYSLTGVSPRCIEILRASCPSGSGNTDDRELCLMSQNDMDASYPNWRSDQASWPLYLIRDLQGSQSLRLYPTPDSNQAATVRAGTFTISGTTGAIVDITGLTSAQATSLYGATVDIQFLCGSLQLYYVAGSTDITSDSTTVETACGISPDFQMALLWFACARACEQDVAIAQAQKAQGYWAKWAEEVQRAKQLVATGMQSQPPKTVRRWRA